FPGKAERRLRESGAHPRSSGGGRNRRGRRSTFPGCWWPSWPDLSMRNELMRRGREWPRLFGHWVRRRSDVGTGGSTAGAGGVLLRDPGPPPSVTLSAGAYPPRPLLSPTPLLHAFYCTARGGAGRVADRGISENSGKFCTLGAVTGRQSALDFTAESVS